MDTIANKNGPPHPMAQLDANEAALAARLGLAEAPYIPPTEKFYQSNYILDGCVAANLRTSYGYYKSAAKQLNSFRLTQRADGMVPGVSHPPQRLRFTFNPERWLSTAPFEGNDYTQSPTWAQSALVLYETANNTPPFSAEQAIDPDRFISEIYPHLARYYDYFIKHRQLATDDPRVFIIHPHEANRDSGPEYDEWKRRELTSLLGAAAVFFERKPRTGEHMPPTFNKANRRNDYFGALAINLAGYKAGWNPARIRERNEFVDVWFNCLLYENYQAMSELAGRLGRTEDKDRFGKLSRDLEQAVITKNSFVNNAREAKAAFYSTYRGMPVYRDTVGNLASLLLRNLPPELLEANLSLMDEGFSPRYPLPSVATFDIGNYDPHYEESDRHWRTPKWIVADEIVMRGLDIQMNRGEAIPETLRNRCQGWFYKIHNSNHEVVRITRDYGEHYNPVTAMGQRMHRTRGHVFGIPSPLLV